MSKTLVLFLAFIIGVGASIGFCTAANANDMGNITVTSDNVNLQDQEAFTGHKIHDPNDPRSIPMQKTGLPILPALLSTLLIGSGLLHGRLRN